jgi:hypothetical protein
VAVKVVQLNRWSSNCTFASCTNLLSLHRRLPVWAHTHTLTRSVVGSQMDMSFVHVWKCDSVRTQTETRTLTTIECGELNLCESICMLPERVAVRVTHANCR